MALSAAASFSFPALAPLLSLLSVFAFASAPLLFGAWASTPTPPFPVKCYNSSVVVHTL